jgi:glutathione S-transferase
MSTNATAAPYVYHGADVSYFSGKARPALLQKGLWYREVLPDYAEIRKRTGIQFIPILVTPEDETWQDTSDILDRLEERHPEPPLYPTTPVQRIVAYLIELYSDEVAGLPAMHYRWSFEESVRKVRADFAANTGNLEACGSFSTRSRPTSRRTRSCWATGCRSPTAASWARSTGTCTATPCRGGCSARPRFGCASGSSA